MRHRVAGRTLSRNAEHRAALLRNLTIALFKHGRIITTVAKAKEARPFVEKLITLAKKNTLHARRLAVARLHDRESVKFLFSELGPRYSDRAGGYTRVIKRHERRLGDAGPTAFLELLRQGERKVQKRKAVAPAPRVEAPPVEKAAETPAAPEASQSPPTA